MDNYVTYDKHGLKEVRCTNCGTIVAQRAYTEVPDNDNPGTTINVMSFHRLPNWKQVKFRVIKNGVETGFIEPIVCDKCYEIELDKGELLAKIKKGWEAELRATGISESKIQEKMKKYDGMEIR